MAQSKSTTLKFKDLDGITQYWAYWCEKLKTALRNEGIKSEDQKRAILLGHLEPQPFRIVFGSVQPTPVSNDSFTIVVDILNEYYTKPKAPTITKGKCMAAVHAKGEAINNLKIILQFLSGHCNFYGRLDDSLSDQFILGYS